MTTPGEPAEPCRAGPRRPAEIDVAALHLARVYGNEPTKPVLRRWAGRIRLWAHRHPEQVHHYGREGRRGVYCLDELRAAATRAFGPPDLDGSRRV